MHVNSHFAIGMIIGMIVYYFNQYGIFITAFIISGAVAPDIDFLFSHLAKEGNHRRLITHSIWPPLVFIIIGLLTSQLWIFYFGIAVLSHLLVDSMDWGLDLLHNGKIVGKAYLFPEKDNNLIRESLEKYHIKNLFFAQRYFASKGIIITEIILVIILLIIMIETAFPYWIFIFGYPTAWSYHILKHKNELIRENQYWKEKGGKIYVK